MSRGARSIQLSARRCLLFISFGRYVSHVRDRLPPPRSPLAVLPPPPPPSPLSCSPSGLTGWDRAPVALVLVSCFGSPPPLRSSPSAARSAAANERRPTLERERSGRCSQIERTTPTTYLVVLRVWNREQRLLPTVSQMPYLPTSLHVRTTPPMATAPAAHAR